MKKLGKKQAITIASSLLRKVSGHNLEVSSMSENAITQAREGDTTELIKMMTYYKMWVEDIIKELESDEEL